MKKLYFLLILALAYSCGKIGSMEVTIVNNTGETAYLKSDESEIDGIAVADGQEKTVKVSTIGMKDEYFYITTEDLGDYIPHFHVLGISASIPYKSGSAYEWNVGTYDAYEVSENSEDQCYIGTFYRGNGDTWSLYNDGTGEAYFKDQNGVCPTGAVFNFDYSISGSSMSISYNSAEVCGDAPDSLPEDETISFSCDDSGITVAGDFYSK